MICILLAFGYAEGILKITLLLVLLFLFVLLKRRIVFRFIAEINKLIIPSLYKKDISKLKNYEKVILVYRYWVTKNSL